MSFLSLLKLFGNRQRPSIDPSDLMSEVLIKFTLERDLLNAESVQVAAESCSELACVLMGRDRPFSCGMVGSCWWESRCCRLHRNHRKRLIGFEPRKGVGG